jgi:hypothetical protein
MFPPDDKSKPKPDSKGKPPAKGGKPGGPPPPGPGGQQNLHSPPIGVPKAGQGIDPMQAMMGGMGDMSQFGPPPPPSPGAPLGPNGLPIGGGLPSSDPGMDPNMDGSGLFQAMNMQLDPMGGGLGDDPNGGGQMGLEQLLQMLAMSQAGTNPADAQGGQGPLGAMLGMGGGMGRPPASGIMNDPTNPGQTVGLNPFNVIQ